MCPLARCYRFLMQDIKLKILKLKIWALIHHFPPTRCHKTHDPLRCRASLGKLAPQRLPSLNRNLSSMRIGIFGAGAVGSHFAVRLALAGHDVSCVMRGPHLKAVKARGLTLRVGDAGFSAAVKACDDPAAME